MFVFQFFDAFSNQGYNTLVKSQDFVQAQTFVIHVLTKKRIQYFIQAHVESLLRSQRRRRRSHISYLIATSFLIIIANIFIFVVT